MNIQNYKLLGDIISLINAENYEATITNLSTDLNLPLPYIRKIISALWSNQVLHNCLIPDTITTDDERILDNQEEAILDILRGTYDHIVWLIELQGLNFSENELLFLSASESIALKALVGDVTTLNRQAPFEKKDHIKISSKDTQSNLDKINEAIHAKKEIRFTYQKPATPPSPRQCYPTEIITNTSDNWIYMRDNIGKRYRLDRIKGHCQIIDSSAYCPNEDAPKKEKYVWGIYCSPDEQPTHVKLRITPETGNLISKIQNDTKYRKDTCRLYQEGDYYYYEDDIIGTGEFQRWVRGYGSSIVVLEPIEMREEIVKRAHEMLDLYDKVKDWNF